MSERNVVQTTFDEFGKSSFGAKKSGSWYRRSEETIVVLNLQKSNYGPSYYVNVAIWLLAAGAADAPKPSHCHVQTRLDRLLPAEMHDRLKALLDLDSPIGEDVRREELLALLGQHLLPLVEAAATLESLRSGEGRRFVEASLVDGDGQRLLAAG
jgi:hypothetical protein